MTLVVPAVLGTVAIAVMAVISAAAARREREAGNRPTSNQPTVLVHSINNDRCTGCEACVAVCPTNVLDLVSHKSHVARFQDCIQCEACMWSCPTTALVMHREGTVAPTLTMPELDQTYQTGIPGMFLAGEVAGKPLVKNAANIGRGIIEHLRATGLKPLGNRAGQAVDVAIVGSGPGGLSAALSCVQRGLSYVLLEKEQVIASTISRYPRGKWVMAEPHNTENLSLLPMFDAAKEQLLATWEQLLEQVGINIRMGEAVESIQPADDGLFDVRTTVAAYRAQRVLLATGLRGKPRTLGVQGENLPKVQSLLEDPANHAGQHVLVVGGGDSALEAAIALADAGATVVLSYRGRAFSRAQNRNKQLVAAGQAEGRIAVRYQSQITEITPTGISVRLADGSVEQHPNDAAFVLIGADPPVKWLEGLGVRFVERPHTFALGATDQFVRGYLHNVTPCPEDPAAAAAQIATDTLPPAPAAPRVIESGRKWIRSASAVFTSAGRRAGSRVGPMPLSEFARHPQANAAEHRDELPDRERTRVLRTLRDDGARLADEDSQLHMLEEAPPPRAQPPSPPPLPPPPPPQRPRRAQVLQRPRARPPAVPKAHGSPPPHLSARPAVMLGLPTTATPQNRRPSQQFQDAPTVTREPNLMAAHLAGLPPLPPLPIAATPEDTDVELLGLERYDDEEATVAMDLNAMELMRMADEPLQDEPTVAMNIADLHRQRAWSKNPPASMAGLEWDFED